MSGFTVTEREDIPLIIMINIRVAGWLKRIANTKLALITPRLRFCIITAGFQRGPYLPNCIGQSVYSPHWRHRQSPSLKAHFLLCDPSWNIGPVLDSYCRVIPLVGISFMRLGAMCFGTNEMSWRPCSVFFHIFVRFPWPSQLLSAFGVLPSER